MIAAERKLQDLRGIGPAMMTDFDMLGVRSVAQLARCDADELYDRLCHLTQTRMDPCVHDVFVCAIEQARNPGLSPEKSNWWYWSAIRKKKRRQSQKART
jgi:nucleotidyltransferase/DNA polymerase involved in DNA repair